jgi:proline dehydrogenase
MNLFNRLIVIFLPLVPKLIVRWVSKPYVAGAKLEDAIRTVKQLNQQGMCATLDVLGESTLNQKLCEEAVADYHHVLDAIQQENLDCNISLKLTQLGLLIDPALCLQNVRRIVEKAAQADIFVRVDMEDAAVTSATIDLFLQLHQEFPKSGIVLQAYLRRSLQDVKKLAAQKINFRLCKGIYIEPRTIAYKNAGIINDNFTLLLESAFRAGSYVGIATHDEKMVWQGLRLIEELGLQHDQYEFQMLLGVDLELRNILVKAGHQLRVYVPFGRHWYAYCVRRLKENPQIAVHVMKAMFGVKK